MTPNESTRDSGLIVTSARNLIRGTGVASLATLEPESGNPYVSIITVATDTDGSPLFLISTLAWHTRNLQADPRASILCAETHRTGDPLALGRISLMGTAERIGTALARARFLAKHPEASDYAGFADFSLWRLRVEKAHYVGGFGRIVTLSGDRLIRSATDVEAWTAGVEGALAEANASHGALIREAARRAEGGEGDWSLAACDSDGCDLVSAGRSLRISFAAPILRVEDIPAALEAAAFRPG